MTRRPTARFRRASTAVLSLALAGCQAAMSSAPNPVDAPGSTNIVDHWPLVFRAHWFGWSCYSTFGCQVHYAGFFPGEWEDNRLRPTSESFGEDYPDRVLRGGAGPVPNFPAPAMVDWRSRDGTRLQATIDIGEIFEDQLVLHNVAQEQAGRTYNPQPEIILEVNDRTINVYMRTRVSTRVLQKQDNPYSGAKIDLIKAFTKTY